MAANHSAASFSRPTSSLNEPLGGLHHHNSSTVSLHHSTPTSLHPASFHLFACMHASLPRLFFQLFYSFASAFPDEGPDAEAASGFSLWSVNFRQLRNGSSISYCRNLLRPPVGWTAKKVIDTRKCNLRSLATKAKENIERPLRSKPYNIHLNHFNGAIGSAEDICLNKLEVSEIIPCYGIQQKASNEWPAGIIALDLGTTGCNLESDRVTEFAARDLRGGMNSTFETLVNPDRVVVNIYACGSSSHSLSRPNVPRFHEIIPAFEQFISSCQIDGEPVILVAHSARRFDVPFLIKEYHRASKKVPSHWLFLDTLSLARRLVKPDGSRLPSLTLKALREHFGIPIVGRGHGAMQDVMTLCYVLQKITYDLKLTPAKLMEATFQCSDITQISRQTKRNHL